MFLKKKEIYVPTVFGWLVVFIIVTSSSIAFVLNAHTLLAYNHPVKAQIIIIEGWVPDFVLQTAISELNKEDYQYILTTGIPLPIGNHLSKYKTYAGLAAASLRVGSKITFHFQV